MKKDICLDHTLPKSDHLVTISICKFRSLDIFATDDTFDRFLLNFVKFLLNLHPI